MYSADDDQTAWFDKVKALSEKFGYTTDMKAYKANPENFKGSVTDVSTAIRVAITGRQNSPDLFSICSLLGYDKVIARLKNAANA